MKIFLDVGGHFGETAKIALEESYGFDKVYSFEPVASCAIRMEEKIKDKRLEICQFGFWNKNCTKKIYKPGSKGASLYRDKFANDVPTVEIKLKKVSQWFRENLKAEDKIFLKLNCEGSEIVILDDLISSREYRKIDVLMVDFDVRKIPSQRHKMKTMKNRLNKLAIPKVFYIDEYNLGHGTHSFFTHYWLDNSTNI